MSDGSPAEKLVLPCLSSYIFSCLELSLHQVGSLLAFVESIEMLCALKKSILSSLKPVSRSTSSECLRWSRWALFQSLIGSDWQEACSAVLGSELSLWDALMRDLLEKRLKVSSVIVFIFEQTFSG